MIRTGTFFAARFAKLFVRALDDVSVPVPEIADTREVGTEFRRRCGNVAARETEVVAPGISGRPYLAGSIIGRRRGRWSRSWFRARRGWLSGRWCRRGRWCGSNFPGWISPCGRACRRVYRATLAAISIAANSYCGQTDDAKYKNNKALHGNSANSAATFRQPVSSSPSSRRR